MMSSQVAEFAPGWQARLSLRLSQLEQRTVLSHSHSGPLRVQRPFYPEGRVCHIYLVHPPAGIVGGDDLQVDVHASAETATLITTPGATQFYRSGGDIAHVRQSIKIKGGSHFDWLPQENIYFDGAKVRTDTTVKLEKDASFMGWDIHCFGRPAADEQFVSGEVAIHQRIERDGKPLLRERMVVAAPHRIRAASGLRDNPVCASLYATPVAKPLLELARQLMAANQSNGEQDVVVTLIDDLLIARYLGHSTQQARKSLQLLWQLLRPEVHQLPACPPRIWAT